MSGAALPNSGERSVAAPEKRASLNERVFVLPLEGKGDRFAVDEVTCSPAPLREAFYAAIIRTPVISPQNQILHKKLLPANDEVIKRERHILAARLKPNAVHV